MIEVRIRDQQMLNAGMDIKTLYRQDHHTQRASVTIDMPHYIHIASNKQMYIEKLKELDFAQGTIMCFKKYFCEDKN